MTLLCWKGAYLAPGTVWEGRWGGWCLEIIQHNTFPKVKDQPFRDRLHSFSWPRLQNRTGGTVRRTGVRRNGLWFKHFDVNKSSGLKLTTPNNTEQEGMQWIYYGAIEPNSLRVINDIHSVWGEAELLDLLETETLWEATWWNVYVGLHRKVLCGRKMNEE